MSLASISMEKNIGKTKLILDAMVVSAIPAFLVEYPIRKNVKTYRLPINSPGNTQSGDICKTSLGLSPEKKYPKVDAMK